MSSVRLTGHGVMANLDPGDGHAHSNVSERIRQLVNTLKRPKKRPMDEFFREQSEEVEGHMTVLIIIFF
jgi:hypothetical protein